jgi:CRISPR-associated protein Csd1
MILQALAGYYERLLNDSSSGIAPPGFETKAIPFLVVISKEGKFLNLRDTRTGEGKKKNARSFLVPQGEKKASGIKANLLWDAPQYLFGTPKSDAEKDKKRAAEAFEAFRQRIEETFPVPFSDDGMNAVKRFLDAGDFSALATTAEWREIVEATPNLTFILEGDSCLIIQRPAVRKHLEKQPGSNEHQQTCSVSGELDVPATLHTAIKGVWGAQSSGANIVSFNLAAFRSLGKEQGLNAPVGEKTVFAYTTALNHLLEKGSRQRMQVGDASTVFWSKAANPIEDEFSWLIGEPPKGEEAVSYGKIRSLLGAVRSGVLPVEDDLPFYVLGLAPNASRIAIRFWYEGSVKEIKQKIAQHFDDVEIIRAPFEPEFISLKRLLLATTRRSSSHPYGDDADIVPNLGGEIFRSVLHGLPYPKNLLTKLINRVKAEQGLCDQNSRKLENVTHARAALIKGILVRNARFTKTTNKEVSVALDREYDNIGYVLGRLFAVLERMQEQAQGGNLNKTVRDTYFGAACSNPLVTFKRLQDLTIHWLAKIRNSGKNTVWLEKLMQEVMNLVPSAGIPPILKIDDQGRFAVGYYHQRQDFFMKKETETQGEEV